MKYVYVIIVCLLFLYFCILLYFAKQEGWIKKVSTAETPIKFDRERFFTQMAFNEQKSNEYACYRVNDVIEHGWSSDSVVMDGHCFHESERIGERISGPEGHGPYHPENYIKKSKVIESKCCYCGYLKEAKVYEHKEKS